MSRCKQCHLDGHHKMSCTDEANPTRKDRVTVPATLNEPIVEGAYYEREDGVVIGPMTRNRATLHYFRGDTKGLTRRIYLVPTDPAEVVAELRAKAAVADARHNESGDSRALGEYMGLFDAADLVAERLGVEHELGVKS